VCVATNQPNTNPNPDPDPATEQLAVVSFQLNVVTCSTVRIQGNLYETDNIVAPVYYFPLSLSLSRLE